MSDRFFIDHGCIHDRETGKHVRTDPDDGYEDGITACCALLNKLASGTPHYYECHVTVEPVTGVRLDVFKGIADEFRFNVATFTKDSAGPDSLICTGRSKTLLDLETRMGGIMETLKAEGFWILRYKLESTILDSPDPHRMISDDEKCNVIANAIKTDEGRVRLAHLMSDSKRPFEEVYAEHKADLKRQFKADLAEWRARPLHEKVAIITIGAFWEFVWLPGKSREGSNPTPYKGGTLRQRIARALKPWKRQSP